MMIDIKAVFGNIVFDVILAIAIVVVAVIIYGIRGNPITLKRPKKQSVKNSKPIPSTDISNSIDMFEKSIVNLAKKIDNISLPVKEQQENTKNSIDVFGKSILSLAKRMNKLDSKSVDYTNDFVEIAGAFKKTFEELDTLTKNITSLREEISGRLEEIDGLSLQFKYYISTRKSEKKGVEFKNEFCKRFNMDSSEYDDFVKNFTLAYKI